MPVQVRPRAPLKLLINRIKIELLQVLSEVFIARLFDKAGRPTRHNLRWYPINQCVAGERSITTAIHGSPYLEFLDLGRREGL